MTAATIGEWVKMGPQDIGSSIYNDMPLTQDRRDFKIKSLEEAVRSQNLGYAQMLAMSREGLVNDDFRKALCKYPAYRLKRSHIRKSQLTRHSRAPAAPNHSQRIAREQN